MIIKHAAKEALVIVLAAVVVAIAVYAIRPDKIGIPASVRTGSEDADHAARQTMPSGFSEIALDETKRLFDANAVIFVDARQDVDFDAGHIRGARNLVFADQDRWLPDFLATTDPATVIITYCDGEHCHLAPELADLLFFNGFDHVFYLKNGWTRWRESGFPVE
ncbi:rhodanese-like domain-containing protein [Desulfosarcina ovata]|uniref:rhodanese-like domain-containing protein n=1 Tax=Desulfosarcina ovata TaxID=83564 RepID=UPI0012D2CC4B|nr:rhodanese-like domain-containing protein [Desulfosarcina ovata]